jgi:hypothetical protein
MNGAIRQPGDAYAELHRTAGGAPGGGALRSLGRRLKAAAAEPCCARGEQSSSRTSPGNSQNAALFL